MVAEPLIDLDRPPPPPAEAFDRRPEVRPFLLVALAVAALLALGGAVPVPPGLTRVLTVDSPLLAFQLGGGSLFAATNTEVRRYDLATGRTVWTQPLDRMTEGLRYEPATGVLLVQSHLDPRLTAFDVATGHELWSAESEDVLVISLTADGLLTEETDHAGRNWLQVVAARTGRLVWTRSFDPAGFLGPDELFSTGSPRIVQVGSDGRVAVISYADGKALSEGDLDLTTKHGGGRGVVADAIAVSVVGDRLYVAQRRAGQTSLAAYSVQPLAALWRSTSAPLGTVSDCGPVLCVADTRWVSAIDPAGGALRWSQPAWGIAYRYDGTRLFAYDNQEQTQTALLDAATGQVVTRLGPGRQLGDLILREDGDRLWVLAGGRTVGAVEDVAYLRCWADGGFLSCPTLDGRNTTWRLP